MFTVYYANQLENQKELLVNIIKNDPNPNPFEQEIILVQSTGMAQWLQMQVSNDLGISANLQFPYPTSFLWQQYRLLFPELPKDNIFDRFSMLWHLMGLIPKYLDNEYLQPLKEYLKNVDQLKLYQLCVKIADLFDQYLVYRPEWLIEWEKGNLNEIKSTILNRVSFQKINEDELFNIIKWQSFLWNELVNEIKAETSEIIFNTSHRAYLQQRYFDKLDNLNDEERKRLPKRIFIFGISSLPKSSFMILYKLAEYSHIHLFFTNPSQYYWGNNQDAKLIEKLALKQRLSLQDVEILHQNQGNPLLSSWGKQGKEFLNLLVDSGVNAIDYYTGYPQDNLLLNQIKNAIFNFKHNAEFTLTSSDYSLQLHACHSKMREVEVLHNQLLYLFEHHPDLSPKDIIVMSPDIDSYAPYVEAVFSRYAKKDEYSISDSRFIPFSLSDQKISYIDLIVKSFLRLLAFKENRFIAEDILDLFNVDAIRKQYCLSDEQFMRLRHWIKNVGIRSGLTIEHLQWSNYNAWQNGLNRLLLGVSLKEENGDWQDILAFDESYGLSAEIAGNLAKFIDDLTAWFTFIQQPRTAEEWDKELKAIIEAIYQEDENSIDIILNLHNAVNKVISDIHKAGFSAVIDIEVIQQLIEMELSEQRNQLNFLSGKVNFCTLLPMRAIPFKVVCLLGMNEGEFPRQQLLNQFDLMQYAPMSGDRARRDDDRYLFLEALLSAQSVFYVSYIGQSLTDNNEKLPSLLVSQLLDYINHNLVENTLIPIKHPMTLFSPKNFANNAISYHNEWLDISQKSVEKIPFLTDLPQQNSTLDISILDLIAYLQEPLKYFFNRQLGIKFEQYESVIDETEHFNLSNLERYYFLSDLVSQTPEEMAVFFQHQTLKGKLPINEFGVIAERELKKSISALQEVLQDYINQENTLLALDMTLEIEHIKFKLVGNIEVYAEQEIIQWRVGKLRDKDIIQFWIYHLIICALKIEIPVMRFYYIDNEIVKFITFKPVPSDKALLLLKQYLQDYLASFSQLKWAITHNIQSYLQGYTGETSPSDYCRITIESIDNAYLDRLLAQTPDLDWDTIHQRTFHWFMPMMEYFIEEE